MVTTFLLIKVLPLKISKSDQKLLIGVENFIENRKKLLQIHSCSKFGQFVGELQIGAEHAQRLYFFTAVCICKAFSSTKINHSKNLYIMVKDDMFKSFYSAN